MLLYICKYITQWLTYVPLGVGTGALFPGLHAPQPFSGGLGTLGSPATQSGTIIVHEGVTAHNILKIIL